MKKTLVLALATLALLVPTMAGFAEKDDFPRACSIAQEQ